MQVKVVCEFFDEFDINPAFQDLLSIHAVANFTVVI